MMTRMTGMTKITRLTRMTWMTKMTAKGGLASKTGMIRIIILE